MICRLILNYFTKYYIIGWTTYDCNNFLSWGPNKIAIFIPKRTKYDCNLFQRDSKTIFDIAIMFRSPLVKIAIIFDPLSNEDCIHIRSSIWWSLQSYLVLFGMKIASIFGPQDKNYCNYICPPLYFNGPNPIWPHIIWTQELAYQDQQVLYVAVVNLQIIKYLMLWHSHGLISLSLNNLMPRLFFSLLPPLQWLSHNQPHIVWISQFVSGITTHIICNELFLVSKIHLTSRPANFVFVFSFFSRSN